MTPLPIKILRIFLFMLILIPLLSAVGWAGYPATKMLISIKQMPAVYYTKDDSHNELLLRELRREIQGHFRKSGIYLPTEDILTLDESRGTPGELVSKVCGDGNIFVWAPLRIRLPYFGERIKETCFKVTTKNS